MRRWAAFVAAAALIALPAAAGASCRSKAPSDAKVAQRSRTIVVYSVDDETPGFEQRIMYGCEFRTGKLRRLDEGRSFAHVLNLKLAGRYIGYSAYEEEPAGQTIYEQVHVDDLRTGERRRYEVFFGQPFPPEYHERVRSLVLKPNGSLAWITAAYETREAQVLQVHRVEAPGKGRHHMKIDEGEAIGPNSLALSENRRRIYWTNAGEPRSARLR